MLNIIWVLWALKIAGLTTISFSILGWLTIGFIIIVTIVKMLTSLVNENLATKNLEKLVKDGDLNETESILGILMLIYKKLP